MTETMAATMAKKRSVDQPKSKTVRISIDAYLSAKKVAKLDEGDLGDYVSDLILKHAPKDYRTRIRKLAEGEED